MASITPSRKTSASVAQERIRQLRTVNMHWIERCLSSFGGATLTLSGFYRHDWTRFALSALGGALLYRGLSGHSFLYQVLRINTNRRTLPSNASVPHRQGVKVEKVLTVERSPQDLYHYWRYFEHFPQFMEHIKEIQILDEKHSHWVVNAPARKQVEWDAEIIADQEGQLIAWRSLPGSSIAHTGSVHFQPAPGGRGTEVRVVLEYVPPAGLPGVLVAKIFGKEPEQQIREELRHFKEFMEAGEIAGTRGQPSGRRK